MFLHSLGQFAILAKAIALALTTFVFVRLLPVHQSTAPIDDLVNRQTEQGPQFHVVASHYGADPKGLEQWITEFKTIPYIQELGLKLTIYTKDGGANVTHLQEITGADEVIRRPNIGRESETYLHHILRNYDNPARFTFFTQAEPTVLVGKDEIFDLEHHQFLTHYFSNTTGFMNMGEMEPGLHLKCDCGHCVTGYYPLLPQLHAMITGSVCYTPEGSDGQTTHLWGQFITSRDRIRERPRRVYEYLHELISAPKGHWIHDETEPRMPLEDFVHESSPSNPLFGHTMERLWPTLFGCADEGREGCEITIREKNDPMEEVGEEEEREEGEEDYDDDEDEGGDTTEVGNEPSKDALAAAYDYLEHGNDSHHTGPEAVGDKVLEEADADAEAEAKADIHTEPQDSSLEEHPPTIKQPPHRHPK
ncbi:MAG: hypothetical protein Q9164_005268 [Protoblastenia rupestris]